MLILESEKGRKGVREGGGERREEKRGREEGRRDTSSSCLPFAP